MKPMGDERKHYWRVLKAAKISGVSLQYALDNGKISKSDYAQMITKCRRCPEPAKCAAQFAEPQVTTQLPDFCVNRDTFAALKD